MRARYAAFRGPMSAEMRAFIDTKRALGCRFVTEEKHLHLFEEFLIENRVTRAEDVTPALIDAFLASRSRTRPRSHNELLGIVRRFFEWMMRQERLDCSPVRARPRRRTAQRIPFIVTPDDARRLLDMASSMPDNPLAPRRGTTYRTIFALLYGLGLRVGEVSRLRLADVDLERQLLVIRDTKFGKSRLVPFGPRVGDMLRQFAEARGGSVPADGPFFSFTKRGPIHPGTISQTFHLLLPKLGFTVPPGVASPRVHDLRHSFAVGTLLRWYREGIDPATRLFHLSTFMGHVSPSSTAVYLTITTELLDAANRRFSTYAATALDGGVP